MTDENVVIEARSAVKVYGNDGGGVTIESELGGYSGQLVFIHLDDVERIVTALRRTKRAILSNR